MSSGGIAVREILAKAREMQGLDASGMEQTNMSDVQEDTGAAFSADDTEYNSLNTDRELYAIRDIAKSLERVAQIAGKPVTFVQGDIRDTAKLKECFWGVDAVIHLAAICNDPIGNLNDSWTEEINYRASVRLAEIASTEKLRSPVLPCVKKPVTDSTRSSELVLS